MADVIKCATRDAYGKALKELGWKAEKTLEEMCRDAWNFRKLRDAERVSC